VSSLASFKRWLFLLALAAVAMMVMLVLLRAAGAAPTGQTVTISGQVVDSHGPISGAIVRWRATEISTSTDLDGIFSLNELPQGQEVEIAAWADGYYITSTIVLPPATGLTLTLRPYHTSDHPDYNWISPVAGSSENACGNCHPMIMDQWISNAHGTAVDNSRFFSLYNGSNLDGSQDIGAGYLKDFPNTDGVCANCHAPGEAIDGYLTTNMNDVRAQITAGVHCDYCHKVGGVYLDPASGSVYPNAPGAQSQRMLRPPEGDQIFFGPYDDIKDPDTYLPAISESAFCAPCHQFSFWGTPIYESFDEWLASPYAGRGITCQECHMPPTGDTHFALAEKGGLPHPPESIPSHLQLGASDAGLLADSVALQVTAYEGSGWLQVTVTITNTGAGHHLPTDFPGRHLILTVQAVDVQGQPLTQSSGPVVPAWGGPQAGQAGKLYAKILKDVASGEFPVVSYWKQVLVHSDNRLPALVADGSSYLFDLPAGADQSQVTAQLLFRRVFQDVADEKQWDTPDIVLAQETVSPWQRVYLPLISLPLE